MEQPSIYTQAKQFESALEEIHEAIVDLHGVSHDLAVKSLKLQIRSFGLVCDAERLEMVEDVKGL